MSIIRGPRPDSNWYNLDKRISEDERLSWAARGLLIFLLGKPDHWEVSVRHLINQTSKAAGKSSGRDAVRVVLKELETVGYLTADIARGEGGAFNGMAYTVCEIPQLRETENPAPVKPATAKPAPPQPTPENPPLVKTERKQPTDSKQQTDPKITDEACASAGGEVLVVDQPKPPIVITVGEKRFEIPAELRYPGPTTKSYKAWMNYAVCYHGKYGAWPVWNQTVAALITKFIARVGAEVAPKVAAFYVRQVNDTFVTKGGHSIKLLLADAEKYHTQYQTGRTITTTQAQQIDKTQTNLSTAEALEADIRARHAARSSQ